MSSLLDRLVIDLVVNARGVSKGVNLAKKDLKTLDQKAEQTGQSFEGAGKAMSGAFSQARNEALALLAVFTGGRSLKAFTADVTKANAELGYTAQRLNINPQKLAQLQNMIQAVGGSASEAATSFQTMQAMLVDPTQHAAMSNILRQLNVNTSDVVDAHGHVRDDILKVLNRSTQGMDQGRKNTLLGALGIGPGEINLIDQSTQAFDKLEQQFKDTGPTQEQIAHSQQLLKDWTALTAQTGKLGLSIVDDVTPGLDHLVQDLAALEGGHPKAIKDIAEITAAIIALGGAIKGVMAVRGVLSFLKFLRSKEAAETAGKAEKSGEAVEKAKKTSEAVGKAEKTAEAAGEAVKSSKTLKGLLALTRIGKIARVGMRAVPILGLMLAAEEILVDSTDASESDRIERLRKRYEAGRSLSGTPSKGNAHQALNLLQNMGFSRNAALGIVGNIAQESRFDPAAVGDGGAAFGLAQWHKDRVEHIKKKFGIDVRTADFNDQVRAYGLELQRGDDPGARHAGQLLRRDGISLKDAVRAVRQYDERPLNADGMEDARRYDLARSAALATQGATHNHTEVHVGDVHIHAQNADGKQIAYDFHRELKNLSPATKTYGIA